MTPDEAIKVAEFVSQINSLKDFEFTVSNSSGDYIHLRLHDQPNNKYIALTKREALDLIQRTREARRDAAIKLGVQFPNLPGREG